MVMTTVHTASARDSEPGRAAVEETQPQFSDKVYPYAAVPVRGGWLVIQM
jgi:hypothetical protein